MTSNNNKKYYIALHLGGYMRSKSILCSMIIVTSIIAFSSSCSKKSSAEMNNCKASYGSGDTVVTIATGSPGELGLLGKLAKEFPENIIVLAHWGGGIFFYNLLKKEVRDTLKNVCFDTAASPFLYDPEIYKTAIRFAGQDKVLFGSDFPLLKPSRYFRELGEAGLSKEEIRNICGENAKKLLKL